jgi:predicted methyltransferase
MSASRACVLACALATACGSAPAAEPQHATTPASAPTASVATPPAAAAVAAAKPAPSASASAAPITPEVVPEPERVDVPPELQGVIDAADRTAEDKSLDVGRQPGMTLAFYSIAEGMNVAELGAGNGYFTEVLARAVAPKGKVFAQNSKAVTDKPSSKSWDDRLRRPALANVVRVDRELDAPLPPEATNLDAVFVALFYHDLYWMKVDRAEMNKAIFNALKPGGVYAVIDHAAKRGDGTTVVKTLHRIEESDVVHDIQAAGFVLDGEATFLRNPRDTKDWSTAPGSGAEKRGTSDRFVLRFKKPG